MTKRNCFLTLDFEDNYDGERYLCLKWHDVAQSACRLSFWVEDFRCVVPDKYLKKYTNIKDIYYLRLVKSMVL